MADKSISVLFFFFFLGMVDYVLFKVFTQGAEKHSTLCFSLIGKIIPPQSLGAIVQAKGKDRHLKVLLKETKCYFNVYS